jgi:hypothetical protein
MPPEIHFQIHNPRALISKIAGLAIQLPVMPSAHPEAATPVSIIADRIIAPKSFYK